MKSRQLWIAILSVVIMILIEYLVLIRIYHKSSYKQDWSLILIPPVLLVISQFVTYKIQDKENESRQTLNPFILVVVFLILKFPFSYYKHDIIPEIGLFERLVISGAEAISATILAEAIVILFGI